MRSRFLSPARCLLWLFTAFLALAIGPAFAQSPEKPEVAPARPAARPVRPTGRPTGDKAVPAATEPVDEAARATARAKGEITFDDLKFDIEPDAPYDASMLTDSIRELDGKNVKLRGYILPSTLFRETDIEEFVLVRDNQECCFGPGAALYDCVVVNLVGGAKTNFTTRPVTVTGKFVLKEYKYPDDSGHFAIFNLQGTAVK